jgi:hypothetical protein
MKGLVPLTDAQIDQVAGGQMPEPTGTGVGTAELTGGSEAVRDAAFPAIGLATTQSGIFPVGHGTITAPGQ